MKRIFLILTAIWALTTLSTGVDAKRQAGAQSQKPAINDPISGEWDMVMQIVGMSIPYKLKLKLEGDKVTGSMDSVVKSGDPGSSAPISSGSFTGGKISFTFDRPEGSVQFNGTLENGKIVGEYGGKQVWQKWEAWKKDDPRSQAPSVNIEGEWEGSYMTFALQNNEITQQLARLLGVSPQDMGRPLKASFKKNGDSYTGLIAPEDKDISKGDPVTKFAFGPDQKIELTIKQGQSIVAFKGALSQEKAETKIAGNICKEDGTVIGRFTLAKKK